MATQGHQWWNLAPSPKRVGECGSHVGEPSQRLSTWLHELGHQIYFWAGEPDLIGVGLLSEYAGKTRIEAAAEAFAACMLAREFMVERFPELAKRVQAMIEQAIAAIKGDR